MAESTVMRSTRRLPSILTSVLMLIVVFGSGAFPQRTWVQPDFVLGTFWDPPLRNSSGTDSADSTSYRMVKESYFNLLTGVQGEHGIDHSFEGMKRALAAAASQGLSYLITDNRIYEAYDHPFRKQTGTEIVRQYRRLGSTLRKALYGYNLCDEPRNFPEHKKNVADWKRFLEKSEPAKLVYYNLPGCYAADYNWGGFSHGNRNGVLDPQEKAEYEGYLHSYVTEMRPEVVSFDHYPFFKDGSIRRDYFYNLEVISRLAGSTPFWAFPMAADHFDYVDPGPAHLSFMYFCPLAYGAKGLVVFTFWPPDGEGFRTALVDRAGQKTAKYDIVQKLNLFVRRVVAPVVMNARHIWTGHASAIPDQQVFVPTLEMNPSTVIAYLEDPLLAGVFQSGDVSYVLVVNKELQAVHEKKIVLRGNVTSVELSPRAVDFTPRTPLRYSPIALVQQAEGECSVVLDELAGGEGRIMRITR